MSRRKAKEEKLTLDQRLDYQTAQTLELTGSWLGATPDFPGGCETLAVMRLQKGRKIINTDLLDDLVRSAKQVDALRDAAIQSRAVFHTLLADLTDETALRVVQRKIQVLTEALDETQ